MSDTKTKSNELWKTVYQIAQSGEVSETFSEEMLVAMAKMLVKFTKCDIDVYRNDFEPQVGIWWSYRVEAGDYHFYEIIEHDDVGTKEQAIAAADRVQMEWICNKHVFDFEPKE